LLCQKRRLLQNNYLSTPNQGNCNNETEEVPPKGDRRDTEQNSKESKENNHKNYRDGRKTKECNFS